MLYAKVLVYAWTHFWLGDSNRTFGNAKRKKKRKRKKVTLKRTDLRKGYEFFCRRRGKKIREKKKK